MKRGERRRLEREEKKKKAVYNLTREQLEDLMIKTQREALAAGSFNLLLGIPVKVLKEEYWPKSYEKKLPKFIDQVFDYYEKLQNKELDEKELHALLKEFGGIELRKNER